MPRRKKPSGKYRLKQLPVLKEYGERCSVGDAHNSDNRIWPMEIGEIEEYDGNGWRGMRLSFSRGRTIDVGILYAGEDYWEIDWARLTNFKSC